MPEHAVHRRADLVAHPGEERALRVVGELRGLAREAQRFLAALVLRDVARHAMLPMHWFASSSSGATATWMSMACRAVVARAS
jgi:hypothetical protein